MKQETYMLPVRCKGCNTVFDLWPVLQEQEQASGVVLAGNHFSRLLRQSFCPDCRNEVLLGMTEQEALNLDEAYEDAPERTDTEIEMMLDLDD
jgi:hypothetical protein